MRKLTYILAALAAVLSSCQKEENLPDELSPEPEEEIIQEEVMETVKPRRFCIQVAKGGDTETKSLDLTDGGANISAGWKEGEQVELFFNQKKDDKLYYYERRAILSVTPSFDPSTATVIGDVYIDPMAYTSRVFTDSTFTVDLYFPHAGFDYTEQKGILKGEGSVEEKYDYAFARIRLRDINHDYSNDTEIIDTDPATFHSQQSIYRFGFKEGGDENAPVDFSEFTIRSLKEKLVVSTTPVVRRDVDVDGEHAMSDLAWTSSYGSITVTPESAPEDHFYYVSIRNEHVSESVSETDTYTFEGYGFTDGALYLGEKEIPTGVLDHQGRFISAKKIRVDKVTVPEQSPAAVSEIW